jgi:hypothetical protein
MLTRFNTKLFLEISFILGSNLINWTSKNVEIGETALLVRIMSFMVHDEFRRVSATIKLHLFIWPHTLTRCVLS